MLKDLQLRRIERRDRPYKMFDGGGLFLLVNPGGSRLWRMRYTVGGREKLLSFGAYPEVSLAAARAARDDARAELRSGRDPSLTRLARRAAAQSVERRFEPLARAWHAQQRVLWTERHAADVLDSLERLVFPALGKIPVEDITVPMVLGTLRPIEARAAETAHRVRQRMSSVFCFAIASGLGSADPAATVKGALRPVVRGRQPAVVELDEARAMLVAIEATPAHYVTLLAMRLLALTAVRPGEIAAAAWSELVGDSWRIPAARMKMRRDHVVPLARQAIEVLDAVRGITGTGPLIFPNARWAHRPMSENALGYLMNRAGYGGRHVPHGWRATFSSVMNERFPQDRAVIDLMLAHLPTGTVEAAYNRAQHLERRRELSQAWADLLLRDAAPAAALRAGRQR